MPDAVTPRPLDRAATWQRLCAAADPIPAFDPATYPDLPAPALRLLTAALPAGATTPRTIELEMRGDIRLRGWMPFTAHQVVRIAEGFVWNARAKRGPLVFRGGDALLGREASLEFRLWGLVPVVRATGPDIARSAAGRLAAETVVWAPQGLTPAAGAGWTGLDAARSTVTLSIADESIDVTVTVGTDGEPTEIATQRWGDPDGEGFAAYPFGGTVDGTIDCGGIRIARTGRVGWHWGTERWEEGEFFRFEITRARSTAA